MTAARKLMTADEFLEWAEAQDGVWELVDGVPVMKRAEQDSLTTQAHDIIRGNIEFSLRSQLRGRCRVFSEAVATRVGERKLRRPDITVDCAPADMRALVTGEPVVVVEILSPSTRRIDLYRKPYEYRSLPSLRHLVTVEPDLPVCTVWSRDDETWTDQPVIGLESVLELPAIAARLPLADIYEGVDLLERD